MGVRFELPEDLLPRLKAREEDAYRLLFEKAFDPLTRYAFGFVKSFDVAKGIVQDTITALWYKGDAFNLQGSLNAYLYSAVRNRALDLIKRDEVEQRYEDSLHDDKEQELPDANVSKSLEEMLAILTEKQRTAIVLRFRDQLKLREIAEVLGISTRNTELLLERALARLRDLYPR